MTITCACWRCTGQPWDDGTLHGTVAWTMGDPRYVPDTDEEPWPCAGEPCACLPERSGAVIAWVLAALLALLVVGVIVWVWPRG